MSSAIISAWRASQPILLLSSFVPITSGQALFTGETTGKGVRSVFVAATASAVRDFTTPANFWTAYTQGVHGRVDAFALYGNLTVFGQKQHYGGVGSDIGILRRSRHQVDAALLVHGLVDGSSWEIIISAVIAIQMHVYRLTRGNRKNYKPREISHRDSSVSQYKL